METGSPQDWQHYHAVTVIRMSLVCSAISGGEHQRQELEANTFAIEVLAYDRD